MAADQDDRVPLFHPWCRFTDDTVLTVVLAIALGGDSDTLACMAGGIAEAFYGGVPEAIEARVREILDPPLAELTRRFRQSYGLL